MTVTAEGTDSTLKRMYHVRMRRNVSSCDAAGLAERVAQGERVVVPVSEHGYGAAGDLIDVHLLGPPRRLSSIDPDDPIVFVTDEARSVHSSGGASYRLHLDDLVVLPSAEELARAAENAVRVVLWCDDGPVAVEVEVGAGVLVLVGSSELLDPDAPIRADNERVARLLDDRRVAGRALGADRVMPVVDLTSIGGAAFSDLRDAMPDHVAHDDPRFLRSAGHAARLLPPALHDALIDLADDRPDAGVLVVRGVEIGPLPPTPATPSSPTGKDLWTEFVLLTVARRLGQPVGYEPEHGGGLVQNLVPVAGAEGRQVSTSSEVLLEFHTETAFHRHRPRYLLLLCLRGDPGASTLVASVVWALERLTVEQRQILAEPRFRLGVDESFAGGRTDRLGRRRAVLSGDPSEPDLTFDADLMVGTDPAASEALGVLRAALTEVACPVVLEPGDLLVVDNHRVVHGRSPFRARYDGTDRWLQRTFVVADLLPSAGERHGRVITTRYRP